jgi:DMSO/TMAO reductase YedYZ molybdopterin-dependent catalytic subunit
VCAASNTLCNDIHCVTRWSKLDCQWDGVLVGELLWRVRPRARARYVMVHAEHAFHSSLPLADLLDESVLLAFGMEGEPLTSGHGGPLWRVVPKRSFWKSVKWVRGFELKPHDAAGILGAPRLPHAPPPWNPERASDD